MEINDFFMVIIYNMILNLAMIVTHFPLWGIMATAINLSILFGVSNGN